MNNSTASTGGAADIRPPRPTATITLAVPAAPGSDSSSGGGGNSGDDAGAIIGAVVAVVVVLLLAACFAVLLRKRRKGDSGAVPGSGYLPQHGLGDTTTNPVYDPAGTLPCSTATGDNGSNAGGKGKNVPLAANPLYEPGQAPDEQPHYDDVNGSNAGGKGKNVPLAANPLYEPGQAPDEQPHYDDVDFSKGAADSTYAEPDFGGGGGGGGGNYGRANSHAVTTLAEDTYGEAVDDEDNADGTAEKMCAYTSDKGRPCRVKFPGKSAQVYCKGHGCGLPWCKEAKSSKAEFCRAHTQQAAGGGSTSVPAHSHTAGAPALYEQALGGFGEHGGDANA